MVCVFLFVYVCWKLLCKAIKERIESALARNWVEGARAVCNFYCKLATVRILSQVMLQAVIDLGIYPCLKHMKNPVCTCKPQFLS